MHEVDFNPDWVSPPADTICSVLKEKKITRADLIRQTGLTATYVEKLLKGTAAITPAIAEKLCAVLGSTAKFWVARDQRYWNDMAMR